MLELDFGDTPEKLKKENIKIYTMEFNQRY